MVFFSPELTQIKEKKFAEQLSGKLAPSEDEALMRSVLQNDKKTIEEGHLIEDALNQGITSFTPDLLYENIVENYRLAKKIYGPKILRMLTGYDEKYLEKNVRIPEFRKEIKKAIEQNVEQLKEKNILDSEGSITPAAVNLAAVCISLDELATLRGTGNKTMKEKGNYGERGERRNYRTGDRYKNISTRATVRHAIKRQRNFFTKEDLQVNEREKKGNIEIIYGIDASASMKGPKLAMAKKAGIALAYHAITNRDKVGLIVFESEVKDKITPTLDFGYLVQHITQITPSLQTDFTKMITNAHELFDPTSRNKHIIILTDALPTVGKEPEKETIHAISEARTTGITISIIGINLDKKGMQLAKEISKTGNGRFYTVQQLNELQTLMIQEYYETAQN